MRAGRSTCARNREYLPLFYKKTKKNFDIYVSCFRRLLEKLQM